MTVICAAPTPTVRQAKAATHVLSLKKKVRFNERVRVRRRTQISFTEEESRAIWFSGEEIHERRRKDKKLRYAIARKPELFGPEKLLVLGLFNESHRRQRNNRAIAARQAVLSLQQDAMDVDADSDSEDSSTFTVTTSTSGCYALHSEASAAEAYERAVQHAAHVHIMDNEDDASETKLSQELSIRSKIATQHVPKVVVPRAPRFPGVMVV